MTIDCSERFGFDRVTQLCACTVCFNITDIQGTDARLLQCIAHHCLLRIRTWCHDASCFAVLIDAGGDDRRVDFVIVGQCVRKPFQQDQPATFRPYKSVGIFIKGAALSGFGQHCRL